MMDVGNDEATTNEAPAPSVKDQPLRVGDRVEHNGYFATVRFIGFIDPAGDGK